MYSVWFSGGRSLYRYLKSPCIDLFCDEIIPGAHSTKPLNPASLTSWERWSLFVYKGIDNPEKGRYVSLKSKIVFQWLHLKIPAVSSTGFCVGIQTRNSHWNKTSLTLYSCFIISVHKKSKIWKGARWASHKVRDNEKKIQQWSRNTASVGTAMSSGILPFLRKPFHEELWNVLRDAKRYHPTCPSFNFLSTIWFCLSCWSVHNRSEHLHAKARRWFFTFWGAFHVDSSK